MTKKRSIQYSPCQSCLVQSQIYCQNVEHCFGTCHRIPHRSLGLRKYHSAWWNSLPTIRKSCKIKIYIFYKAVEGLGKVGMILEGRADLFLSPWNSNQRRKNYWKFGVRIPASEGHKKFVLFISFSNSP